MRCVKEAPGRAWATPGVPPQGAPPTAGGPSSDVDKFHFGEKKLTLSVAPRRPVTGDGPQSARSRSKEGEEGRTTP